MAGTQPGESVWEEAREVGGAIRGGLSRLCVARWLAAPQRFMRLFQSEEWCLGSGCLSETMLPSTHSF